MKDFELDPNDWKGNWAKLKDVAILRAADPTISHDDRQMLITAIAALNEAVDNDDNVTANKAMLMLCTVLAENGSAKAQDEFIRVMKTMGERSGNPMPPDIEEKLHELFRLKRLQKKLVQGHGFTMRDSETDVFASMPHNRKPN